ncbi:MAG TPA: ABC transporter permease subunit [Candidatus Saccharimonadales bacterium]|nr:ABC transporter permease subunit [Candidatus Saccharimonadales bacterium]
MIPIIKWSIWQRKVSTIWWSISIFALIFVTLIVYPPFRDEAQQLQKSFENLPDAAIQLFGGSADFFSPVGFLNSQIFFIVLPLALGILAITVGHGILGKEEQDLTIESLLSRPISRTKLLLAKALTAIIILTFVSLVCLITTLATIRLVDLEVADKPIILTMSACYLMSLSLGAIAFLFSSVGRKIRGAGIGIATFIALGGYIISSLAGTVDWLRIPAKAFPFHYYQSEAILKGFYNWNNVYFFVGIIIFCTVFSWLSFRRRDIY